MRGRNWGVSMLAGCLAAAGGLAAGPVAADPQPAGSAAPPTAPAQPTEQADTWSYPMQGGGIYKPPADPPPSAASDVRTYGRT